MELWFTIIVSICIALLLKSIFTTFRTSRLPPGPPTFPVIGNLFWLRNSFSQLESIIRRLKTQYGPLLTLKIGPRHLIFVTSHSIAHSALIQNGAIFSDRPAPPPVTKILIPTRTISGSSYGPTWRLLRRNLTQEVLHPGRVKSHAGSRRWVLSLLLKRIVETDEHKVRLIDHFQYAMFCLIVFMCFGDKLEEKQIREIESIQRQFLLSFGKYGILNRFPVWLGKILFPKKVKEVNELREKQVNMFTPLIRARMQSKPAYNEPGVGATAYVDTLANLEFPEEGRKKLDESEMVTLCSELLNGGTDTTSTALQWIMANLVKNPKIQSKLYEEIISVLGPPPTLSTDADMAVVEEEDTHKMPYLKAVVLEGLRRHPPGHFVLPHKVTHDVELEGYVIPKNAILNFMIADMGWDPKVWEDPMEFKPERFLNRNFDITGSKEIKMMPFGVGRRICPASGMAMLHLEYFVANLIWYFEWKPLEGDEVDLSEKTEFTVVMKNPLCARISPRI